MKDFTGREITVGDNLAITTRASSGTWLYGATVMDIEEQPASIWVGKDKSADGSGYEPNGTSELLTLRLTSNGRIQKDKYARNYEELAVILPKV